MPRLVGKKPKSNLYMGLFTLVIIGAVGVLEYNGLIDLIPGIDKNQYQSQVKQ